MGETMFRRSRRSSTSRSSSKRALARQGLVANELTVVLRRPAARRIPRAPRGRSRRCAARCPARARARRRRPAQRASLKQIGDVSLFVSGFFSDSLRRKLVDVDYYVSIGGVAYQRAQPRRDRHLLAGLCRARREIRRVRGCAVRGQRAVVLLRRTRICCACTNVAQDRQPPQRPAPGRAGRRAQLVAPVDPRPVASRRSSGPSVTLELAQSPSPMGRANRAAPMGVVIRSVVAVGHTSAAPCPHKRHPNWTNVFGTGSNRSTNTGV